MAEDMVTRTEFNAGMASLRDQVAGVKEVFVERITRAETLLERVDDRALAEAEDRGRTKAQLEALERQQREDREKAEARSSAQDLKIWGLIVLALGALVKFALGLLAGGPGLR